MPVVPRTHFVYHQTVNVTQADARVSAIAAAIGEPARARMLFCLLDGRARTGTELAVVADVTPSTASVHLQKLLARSLITVVSQGKHRYYSLEGPNVAAAIEALSVVAGGSRRAFEPGTPNRLRAARTCYDHIAGALGVALCDRATALEWLSERSADHSYDLTPAGAKGFDSLGVDVAAARAMRRRFAFACVDWSERRPHIGGALGAALLKVAIRRKWVVQDLDSRILTLTAAGRRDLGARLGLRD